MRGYREVWEERREARSLGGRVVRALFVGSVVLAILGSRGPQAEALVLLMLALGVATWATRGRRVLVRRGAARRPQERARDDLGAAIRSVRGESQ